MGSGWRRWLAATLPVTPLLRWVVLVHVVPPDDPWRTGCPHCGRGFSPAAGLGPLLPPGRCGGMAATRGGPGGEPPVPGTPDPAATNRRIGHGRPSGAPPMPAGMQDAAAGRSKIGCGRPIGAPPYLLEVATLAAAALVAVALAGGAWSPWAAVALVGWAAVAVALTFIDFAVHRLPDRLTLPVAAWVLGWLGVAAATSGDGAAWVRAALAAAACGLGFAAFTLIFRSVGYGLGDSKLAISAGALLGWLGWSVVLAGLLLAFVASALVATVLLLTRRAGWRDRLPFGPYLVAGPLAALAWAGLPPAPI